MARDLSAPVLVMRYVPAGEELIDFWAYPGRPDLDRLVLEGDCLVFVGLEIERSVDPVTQREQVMESRMLLSIRPQVKW